jgi:hypothetical protein
MAICFLNEFFDFRDIKSLGYQFEQKVFYTDQYSAQYTADNIKIPLTDTGICLSKVYGRRQSWILNL